MRAPGERVYPLGTVGSNPTLSAPINRPVFRWAIFVNIHELDVGCTALGSNPHSLRERFAATSAPEKPLK